MPASLWSLELRGLRPVPVAVDALVAGAVGVVVLVDRFDAGSEPGTRPADLLSVVLVLLAVAGTTTRRLRPRAAGLVVLGALVVAALLGEPDLGLLLLAGLSAYTAAAAGTPPVLLASMAAVLVLARFVSAVRALPVSEAALGAALDILLMLVAVLLGRASVARNQQEEQRMLTERRAAEHRLTQERVYLAREMHDVVAHAVTAMVVQADGAHGLAARDPDRVDEALLRIQESGRQATGELRALLGVLRVPGTAGPDGPQPGLDQLAALAATFPALSVEVREHGAARGHGAQVSPGVELAAYRIVQEALTNAVRHGDARHVLVDVHRGPGEVRLDITDDGAASAGTPQGGSRHGFGLAGMRERAALHHGSLTAGPADGGGWRVQAVLRDREQA